MIVFLHYDDLDRIACPTEHICGVLEGMAANTDPWMNKAKQSGGSSCARLGLLQKFCVQHFFNVDSTVFNKLLKRAGNEDIRSPQPESTPDGTTRKIPPKHSGKKLSTAKKPRLDPLPECQNVAPPDAIMVDMVGMKKPPPLTPGQMDEHSMASVTSNAFSQGLTAADKVVDNIKEMWEKRLNSVGKTTN